MPTPEPRRRGWPRTLYGRLVLVLVAGMLLAQVLTGTIWYDVRYEQVMEMPARLAAARVAQALRLIEPPHALDPAMLAGPDFALAVRPPQPAPALGQAQRDLEQLLSQSVAAQLGQVRPLQLLQVTLYDERGRSGRLWPFLSRAPQGRFVLQVRSVDGRWLRVEVRTGQAGRVLSPAPALRDYLLRIYGLRTLVIVLLALAVVRWLTRPLTRLVAAAQALGRDIRSPPLPVSGPREVRQAAQAFNQMQQRVLEGMQAREALLASVSHDLRSPITRLRLRAEMLPDPQARLRWRTDLEDMQALVDSTLDYLSEAAEAGPPQQIDMDSLLLAVAADLRELGAQVQVEAGSGARVAGQARGLKRAVANLMENAVRHGGQVRAALRNHGERLRLTIDDAGPGIPEAAMARVLQPFVTLEGAAAGRGLGLGIAEGIVRAHGGRLTLRNRLAADGRVTGLRVEVDLPRMAQAAEAT